MKVAVSIQDPVFEAAERASRRLRLARSRLYALAVEEYVRRHSDADVTAQLDALYASDRSQLDPLLESASIEVLRREKW